MAKDSQFVGQIADIEKDFPQWYTDVVLKTKMVDYGPVKGTMVIRPYAYAIWENIQREMDKRFKAQGVEKIVFVTKGATSAFLLSDLLDKGEGGEAYRLTHNGKAVTFTLGESMADVSAILTRP